MVGIGSPPGERRGGRRPGTKNRATVERETVQAEVRAQRIAAGVAVPVYGKEKLEWLLGLATAQLQEVLANNDQANFGPVFDRVLSVARALTPYQEPQLRAIAVAHTGLKPPPQNLDRLNAKQLETLRELLRLMGPSNIAEAGPADNGGARPLRRIQRKPNG
jgi:hypothetical protein